MFEAQIREFQNKWNVIVTVLDISPDPADVHENFDRLAMSMREIPKVFISTARCLSHGPKGLRPPVTKESVLLVQARKKQQLNLIKEKQQQEQEQQRRSPTQQPLSSNNNNNESTETHQHQTKKNSK